MKEYEEQIRVILTSLSGDDKDAVIERLVKYLQIDNGLLIATAVEAIGKDLILLAERMRKIDA